MRARYNNNREASSEEEYANISAEDGEEEEYEKNIPRTNSRRRSSRGNIKKVTIQEDVPSMHLRDRRNRVSYAEIEASDYEDEEDGEVMEPPVSRTSRRRRVASQVKQASGDAQYSTRSRRQTKRINYREMDDLQIEPEGMEDEEEHTRPRRNTRRPSKYEQEEEEDHYQASSQPEPSPLRRSSRKRTHPKSYIEEEGSEENVDADNERQKEHVVPVSKRSRIQYHASQSASSSADHEKTTTTEIHAADIRQNEPTVIVETESSTEVTSSVSTNNGHIYERTIENGHVVITAAYNGALANAHQSETTAVEQASVLQPRVDSDQDDILIADAPRSAHDEAANTTSSRKEGTPAPAQNERRRQRRKEDSDGEYEPEPIAHNEEEEPEHESEEEEEDVDNSSPAKRTARTNSRSQKQTIEEEEMEEDEDEEAAYVRKQRRAPTRTRTRRYARKNNPPTSEEEASDDAPLKNRLRPRNQKQVNPYTHYISTLASQSQKSQQRSPSRYEELQAKYAKQRSEIMRQIPPSPQTITPQSNVFISDDSASDSSDDDVPPTSGVPASTGGMATKSNLAKNDKYSHIAPINLSELNAHKKGRPSADIDPMKVGNVGWDQIGGLQHHVDALKEMVVLPLLYPEVFQKFDITPPRGVIFFGPPGTGKTLVARALANTCSHGARPIAFFMRKGADILSKWVGEAEKQLRLLFDEAKKLQPSIIFFDEIDGLAPVRSSKQDYIHSSIVSTLLALMDGLDNRGQVVVIGATNRIDSIDPALRRPGRFDRELIFTLPSKSARKEIFDIHTKNWNPSVPRELAEDIAKRCVGYCGADLKALCAESALCALKRKYPQVYSSSDRLLIDVNTIQVQKIDFLDAMKSITPASHRSAVVHSRPLPTHLAPLLTDKMDSIKSIVKQIFPISTKHFDRHDEVKPQQHLQIENGNSEENMTDCGDEEEVSVDNFTSFADISFMDHNVSDYMINPPAYRPWLLVYGSEGMGQLLLARAILYALEELALFSLDFASLITNQNVRSAEEALISTFAEARKNSPSVLWIPNIDEWWEKSTEVLQSTFCSMLQDLPSSLNILVIATVNNCKILNELPLPIQKLFNEHHYHVKAPTTDHREAMFSIFIKDVLRKPLVKQKKNKNNIYPELPKAPLPPVEIRREQLISEEQDAKVRKEEEHFLRELRIRLRDPMLRILTNKRYEIFAKPPRPAQNGSGANPSTSSDNGTTNSNPDNLLYLYDILDNLERHRYDSLKSFNSDIKQIVRDSALYQSNIDDFATTRNVSKALQLYETLKSMYQLLPQPLVKKCAQIAKRRQKLAKERAEIEKANQAARQTETASASGSATVVVSSSEAHEEDGRTMDVETTEGTTLTDVITTTSSTIPPDLLATPSLPENHNSVETEAVQASPAPDQSSLTTVVSEENSSHQEPQPSEEQPLVPDVVIDKEALQSWFGDFLTITEGSTVEELDKHFSQLYKTLYKYRFTANRNPLIGELKEFLNTLRTLEEFR